LPQGELAFIIIIIIIIIIISTMGRGWTGLAAGDGCHPPLGLLGSHHHHGTPSSSSSSSSSYRREWRGAPGVL
jgi:hypothetical protein